MTEPVDLAAPRPVRLGAVVLTAVLHLLVVAALVRAFAPDLVERAVERVVATFAVPSPQPSPPPPTEPQPGAAAGTAGAAGRHATPRSIAVPPPRLVIARSRPAPPVAANGMADRAGARNTGNGSGAAGAGSGPGSGGAGTGQGQGGGAAVKIAGEINSARDYPAASRDLRIGDRVVVALTVGTDGRPTACRVVRASRDAAADAITCRLALARFRFRPATNAAGDPVEAVFGWQQRWFYPGAD